MELRRTTDAQAFIRAYTRPIVVAGLEPLVLWQADELTPIWQATEADLDARQLAPPFWAFAWAGGQGVARFIREYPEIVAGKRVLDVACGSGMAGIVAAMAGAGQVFANDIDAMCEAAVALNAELNTVTLNWMDGDLLDAAPLDVDVILAGDVFYEKPMAERFLAYLLRAKARGIEVYAGDPGRAYVPAGLQLCGEYEVATSLAIENSECKVGRVWRV